jgi:hypothetical protein
MKFIKSMSFKEDLESFKNSEYLHYSTEETSYIQGNPDFQ